MYFVILVSSPYFVVTDITYSVSMFYKNKKLVVEG